MHRQHAQSACTVSRHTQHAANTQRCSAYMCLSLVLDPAKKSRCCLVQMCGISIRVCQPHLRKSADPLCNLLVNASHADCTNLCQCWCCTDSSCVRQQACIVILQTMSELVQHQRHHAMLSMARVPALLFKMGVLHTEGMQGYHSALCTWQPVCALISHLTFVKECKLGCRNLAAELGVSCVQAYKMDATTALLRADNAHAGWSYSSAYLRRNPSAILYPSK